MKVRQEETEVRTRRDIGGERLRLIGMLILLLGFYMVYFSILCTGGLSADDMWNSNLWANPYTKELTIWQQVTSQFVIWLHLGRFFPISQLILYVFGICRDVVSYRLAIILATYLCNLIAGLCVKEMTGSKPVMYLYMLLFPVLIQITPEFDSGLYCYHTLIQTVTMFGLLGMYGMQRYLDTEKKRYMVLSACSLLCALCTYEVGFVFILPIALLAWDKKRKFKTWFLTMLPDGIVFVILCVVNVVIRKLFQTGNYDGISLSLDPKLVLITLIKQCSTCVPLGRYLVFVYQRGILNTYPFNPETFLRDIKPLDVLSSVVFLGLFAITLYGLMKERKKRYPLGMLLGCGLLLFLMPGLLIAVSAKYQAMLGWCSGHLPALLQSFGFTMLLVFVTLLLWKRAKSKWLQIGIGVFCALLAAGGLLVARVIARDEINIRNMTRRYPQDQITLASEVGLFDEMDGDLTAHPVGLTAYIYDDNSCRQFYSKLAKHNLNAMTAGEMKERIMQGVPMEMEGNVSIYAANTGEDCYYGIMNMANRDSAALIIGKIATVEVDAQGTMQHVWIKEPKLLLRGGGESVFGVDTVDWELIEETETYRLYQDDAYYDILPETTYYESGGVDFSGGLYRESKN